MLSFAWLEMSWFVLFCIIEFLNLLLTGNSDISAWIPSCFGKWRLNFSSSGPRKGLTPQK